MHAMEDRLGAAEKGVPIDGSKPEQAVINPKLTKSRPASTRRPWWKSPVFWAVIALVSIAVALSVGLTVGRDDNSGDASGKVDGAGSGLNVGDSDADDLEPSGSGDGDDDGNTTDSSGGGGHSVSDSSSDDDSNTTNSSGGGGHFVVDNSTDDGSKRGEVLLPMLSELLTFGVQVRSSVETFSAESLHGYQTCDDLEGNLTEAMKYLADLIITGKSGPPRHCFFALDGVFSGLPSGGGGTGDTEKKGGGGEDSYSTNNQEAGVDEADVVKSNGMHVFAVYGDELVVWDATNGTTVLSRTTMPAVEIDCDNADTESGTVETATIEKKAWFAPHFDKCHGFNPKPKIEALLLHEDRLVTVVTGYGERTRMPHWLWCDHQCDNGNILSHEGETHVRVYDISNIPNDGSNLTLLGTKELDGVYHSARSTGSDAHVVTMSEVDTWCEFEKHISQWTYYNEKQLFSEITYEEWAKNKTEEVLPSYIEKMMDDLALEDCTTIARIGVFQTGNQTDDEGPDLTSGYGFIQGYARVHSFNISESHQEQSVSSTLSSTLLPSTSADVYASQKMLVLAAKGHYYDPISLSYTQSTYLMGFHLREDGTSKATTAGLVPGHLLDQFSMDHYGDYLRVVTTSNARWGKNENGDWAQLSLTTNQLVVLQLPDFIDANEVGLMEEVGSINSTEGLGKENERVFAVRFVDEAAFVVTFLLTDPFYTINLTDPFNPFIAGEHNITGFSNYLHPINEDNTLVLAVGQEANDENGRPMGLQITSFDVSDLSNPHALARYTLEDSDDLVSRSAAQFEHKAFRYLNESKMLILPARVRDSWSWRRSFDGFLVFDVGANSITQRFNISHYNWHWSDWGWCWKPASLDARSLVFDGKVTTLKSHTVQSHNLTTGEHLWELNLDLNNAQDGKCYGWFGD